MSILTYPSNAKEVLSMSSAEISYCFYLRGYTVILNRHNNVTCYRDGKILGRSVISDPRINKLWWILTEFVKEPDHPIRRIGWNMDYDVLVEKLKTLIK